MKLKEYKPGTKFPGVVGRTVDQSSPAWPEPVRAKTGAPNILFFVLDDVGYGQLSSYGGLINTPTLDRLAENGLRYTNMHTAALCTPTRTCILTGRNHHSNATNGITEAATGYPGAHGMIPLENGFLSEMLLEHGYNTFAVGKWHLTPSQEASGAGPFTRWPLGRGFERYYGFLGGDTHQYYPDLVYDNHPVDPPKPPEEGYHLTEDLADRAIGFIQDAHVVAPDKPFFMLFATGAGHAPHQVPKEWADRYQGKFDNGWQAYRETVYRRQVEMGIIPPGTELPPPDADIPRWESLSADEKRLYARMMEVYAGFIEHTDHQFGRIVDFIKELGELDNTLIMVISDNGASAEGGPTGSVNEMLFFNYVPESLETNLAMIDELGGPDTYNHYPWGWTWAGDTPFRRWKRETYRGGISDPLIVHWSAGIGAQGELRDQYVHAIDMLPTVLEALDLEPPAAIRGATQSPIEGVSFAHTFADGQAATKHITQYYESLGHRSIYHDGWKAVCPWPGASFAEAATVGRRWGDEITSEAMEDLERNAWELYHVAEDLTENKDLAEQNPGKLHEMVTLWWTEAGKYNVLPLDGRGTQRFATPRPQVTRDREQYVYYPGGQMVGTEVAANVKNRPHSITAQVVIPEGGAEGVLLAHGALFGGYALYVKDRRLHYVHNYVGREEFRVTSATELPEGKVTLRFEFEKTTPADIRNGKGAGGRGHLYVNGEPAGSVDIPVTCPIVYALAGEGLCCGYDGGQEVTADYSAPFPFTGTIERVTVDVSGALIVDEEAEERRAMARQ